MSAAPKVRHGCTCGTRAAWRVVALRCNYSAFSGYKRTPSEWSEVRCLSELGGCGRRWRTRARYVDELELAPGA